MEPYDHIFLSYLEAIQPSDEVCERREATLDTLEDLFSQARISSFNIINRDVLVFGSHASGFYGERSDIDVILTGELDDGCLLENLKNDDKVVILTDFLRALERADFASEVELVANARVPVLKLKTLTGIDVDVSIGARLSPLKGHVLNLLRKHFRSLRILYPLVKTYAKAHELNSGSAGTANSFCLSMLVVFFLQTTGLMPPLWEILYDTCPDPGAPKVQDQLDKPLEEFVAEVEHRCKSVAPHYRLVNEDCSPVELLNAFLTQTKTMLRNPYPGGVRSPCDLMLSPLFGDLLPVPDRSRDYLFVEDPFANVEGGNGDGNGEGSGNGRTRDPYPEDNCARTFGRAGGISDHDTLDYFYDSIQQASITLGMFTEDPESIPFLGLCGYLFGPKVLLELSTLAEGLPAAGARCQGLSQGIRAHIVDGLTFIDSGIHRPRDQMELLRDLHGDIVNMLWGRAAGQPTLAEMPFNVYRAAERVAPRSLLSRSTTPRVGLQQQQRAPPPMPPVTGGTPFSQISFQKTAHRGEAGGAGSSAADLVALDRARGRRDLRRPQAFQRSNSSGSSSVNGTATAISINDSGMSNNNNNIDSGLYGTSNDNYNYYTNNYDHGYYGGVAQQRDNALSSSSSSREQRGAVGESPFSLDLPAFSSGQPPPPLPSSRMAVASLALSGSEDDVASLTVSALRIRMLEQEERRERERAREEQRQRQLDREWERRREDRQRELERNRRAAQESNGPATPRNRVRPGYEV